MSITTEGVQINILCAWSPPWPSPKTHLPFTKGKISLAAQRPIFFGRCLPPNTKNERDKSKTRTSDEERKTGNEMCWPGVVVISLSQNSVASALLPFGLSSHLILLLFFLNTLGLGWDDIFFNEEFFSF